MTSKPATKPHFLPSHWRCGSTQTTGMKRWGSFPKTAKTDMGLQENLVLQVNETLKGWLALPCQRFCLLKPGPAGTAVVLRASHSTASAGSPAESLAWSWWPRDAAAIGAHPNQLWALRSPWAHHFQAGPDAEGRFQAHILDNKTLLGFSMNTKYSVVCGMSCYNGIY